MTTSKSTSPWPIISAALLSALTTGGVTIGWQASGSPSPASADCSAVDERIDIGNMEIGVVIRRVTELERRVTDLERPPRAVVLPQHPGRIGSAETSATD